MESEVKMGRCSSYIIRFKFWSLDKSKKKRARVPMLTIFSDGNLNKCHGQFGSSYYMFKDKYTMIGNKYFFK